LEGLEQAAKTLAIDGVTYEDTVDTGLVKHGVSDGGGSGEKKEDDSDAGGRGRGAKKLSTTTETASWGAGEESVEVYIISNYRY